MNDAFQKSGGSQPQRSKTMGHSVSLLTIFGIEIRLDISVIVIFLLIVYDLGNGTFPQWHPDWSSRVIWGTAFVSGVLFFASLLAHELSHSVVAQKFGIPVPRITLFLFGGMA
jgi:Zn-dependent protease